VRTQVDRVHQQVIERGVGLASGSEIEPADLPESMGQRGGVAKDRLHLPFKDAKESMV